MDKSTDVISVAKERYKKAKQAWEHVYREAKNDLRFLSDEEFAQWDEAQAARRARVGLPVIQVDQLNQFVHQVANDIRMNTPTIKAIPADMESDIETADILNGRIKAIEYKSNADAAYDMAADFSVKSSIGFIRVDREYIDDSFDQELRIRRVINPLGVLLDPDSTEPDGSDAKYAFVFDEITKEQFEQRYPDATPVSFGDEKDAGGKYDGKGDYIAIVEYFCCEEDDEYVGLLPDGKIEAVDKRKKYKQTRTRKKRKIKHCKLSGEDVLEETYFPGKYIPIVPVYGEEMWVDGKRHLFSLIRKSKSAQQMYNLWKSLETELLLKQQQSPVQAAVGQMRGFEEDWKTPDKAMVLYYHQTDANGDQAPPPQRLPAPQIPTGIVNAARETIDDIKATMGLYNASIGQRSNETSGVAIQRRQQEGDVATFHFGDNLTRSITQVGRIIVSALPEIEDTAKVVQIIGDEEEIKQVGINGALVDGQERTYDITKGKFDIRVTTGASFTTQRQEAAQLYTQIITSMPDLMPVIGDLVFKYQDTAGAQAISARLKKLVDPKLLDESEREEGEPDPQIVALQQQLQAVMQQAQQMQAELQSKQNETAIKAAELQIKNKEVDIKAEELKIKYIQAIKPDSKSVASPQESMPNVTGIPLDAPLEVFQAAAQAKINNDMAEQEKKQREDAMEQEKEQREEMMKQRELELEMIELQQREQQANAVVSVLNNISAQLNALTATVSQPIKVMRDSNGNIVGAE